ncbi:cbb3-type cytochrome c oxidase subunit 3 [Salinimonas marina]|uniref:Cbb3-type cytochrome c oxidase subunit 3 n=1 Tax=Salinimonas marina TaxID=2785918 RepID=A0A7S9HEA7_9ALTE|nr:cbb3-type cytochrome c oxidase subunit 3 [Salinimonas marina]QPG07025.1 cbb3-type cytochrome c oxidase subunit 3 [Salinimonas marina]
MDQGIVGTIFTLLVFICFFAVVWWAFSSRNKDKFDDAANLPFADEGHQESDKKKRES